MNTRRGVRRHLPVEPLVALVDLQGGPAGCGIEKRSALERAYHRARRQGFITWTAADEIAVRALRLNPGEVWGDTWWDLPATKS